MYARLILALALFAAITQGAELGERAKQLLEECRKENNLDAEKLKEAFKSKKLGEIEGGKCFLECSMTKFGIIRDGKYSVEKAKEINARGIKDAELLAKANQVVDKCANVQNPGGKCNFGIELAKCFSQAGKEVGITKPIFEM